MVNPSMCRVCESTKNLTDIFVKNDQKILNQMRLFLNHSIDVNDRLPQCICIDCVAQLNDAYNFKIQYELLNQKYQKAVLSVSDEDEKVFSCQTAETPSSLPNYGFIKNELDKDAVEVIVLNESDAEQDDIASGSKTAKTESVYVSEIVVKEELSPTYLDDDTDDEEDDDEKDNKVSQIDSAKMGECSGLNGANSTNNEGKPRQRLVAKRSAGKVSIRYTFKHDDGSESFRCEKCNKQFGKHCYLIRHILSHHDIQFHTIILKCSECPKTFKSKKYFSKHVLLHQNPEMFKHQKYEKRFSCTGWLKRHEGLNNNRDQLTCKKCKKRLSCEVALRNHTKLHDHDPDVFICKKCEMKLTSEIALRDHEKLHDEPDAFACEKCNKIFSSLYSLKQHAKRTHSSNIFKCSKCSKIFKRIYNLKEHELFHKNPNSLKCLKCEKQFSKRCLLKEHYKVHSNPDAFKCKKCEKKLSCLSSLRQHEKYVECNSDKFTRSQDI